MSHRSRFLSVALVVAVAVGGAACGDDGEKGAPGGEPTPTSTGQQTTSSLPGNHAPNTPGGSVPGSSTP